jgi:hypothetical protein
MALQIQFDPERRVVISVGWGVISEIDLIVSRRLLLADERFDPSFDRIWDFAGATRVELPDDTLRTLASKCLSDVMVRRAVVCVAPAVVSRVLDMIAEARLYHRDFALFPSRREAMDWIGGPRDSAVALHDHAR